MIKREWQKLFHNKILMIVMVAIVAIPTIYTTLFLGSMWDPYGKVDQLPVVVVNKDQPVEYEGKELDVGGELVDSLKDNDSLNFCFADEETATEGLADGTYYMMLTIPEDFSANAATLMDDEPQKMELTYEVNPGTNYIASKMSESAVEKIKNSVAEEVTKTYTEAVFDQIAEAGDGMQEAADGSGELKDGVQQIIDGNDTIEENLQLLADSTLTFKDGSEELEVGLAEYVDGVVQIKDGAVELADGATELKDGIASADDGAKKLADGTDSLTSGAKTLKDGTSQVYSGLSTLNDSVPALATGVSQLAAGGTQLAQGASSLSSAITTTAGWAQELNNILNSATSTTSNEVAKLSNSVQELSADNQSLVESNQSLDITNQELQNQIVAMQKDMANAKEAVAQISGTTDTSELQNEVSSLQEQIAALNDAVNNLSYADTVDVDTEVTTSIDVPVTTVAKDTESENDEVTSYETEIVTQEVTVPVQTTVSIDAPDLSGIQEQINAISTSLEAISVQLSSLQNTSDQEAAGQALSALGNAESYGNVSYETAEGLVTEYTDIDTEYTDGGIATYVDSYANTADDGIETYSLTPELLAKIKVYVNNINATLNGGTVLGITGQPIQSVAAEGSISAGATGLVAGAGKINTGLSSLSTQVPTLTSGVTALTSGAKQLDDGASSLVSGSEELKDGAHTLADGTGQLLDGAQTLQDGTYTLLDGTVELASNNDTLLDGANALSDGAGEIADGAQQLHDGSVELADGLDEVYDGADTLQTSLADGAQEVKDNLAEDDNIEMFASPVEASETKMTEVANNGHAMAPYMMSVALWVGCLAFCLMYPLTEYYGALKSGSAWWMAKASVLYLVAVLQAFVMIGCLHLFNDFTPADIPGTLLIASVASVAFMSIMYFFNVTMGKVGSFLMLIFMVVQLAGSAGTYPIELSGSFVAKIHDYLPFSYTVTAFRRTIAGSGDLKQTILILAAIAVAFTILTIVEFQIRAHKIHEGKKVAIDWLEAKGLA